MLRRLVLPALLGLAAYYAVFGGEYSVPDLRSVQADVVTAEADRDALAEEVARLESRADALENDPATLEQLARERFGMIRDGEVLYRFAEDSPAPPAGS
ncbi:MAG: septum formation initiator family protein [Gemmatimonadales bacterium]|nr:MAG: septum formation initiator family protein [Gemmatimonadales bacterium]